MDKLIFPSFLNAGDKIAIVSPSGRIDQPFLNGAVAQLSSWGFKPVLGEYASDSSGHYAGTIEHRTEDFQMAMDDEGIKAIFCSRGGYGVVHILNKLDFMHFREHPKWLLGFSDITALHSLFQSKGYASVHSPMARHLTIEAENDPSVLFLKNLLFGQLPRYNCPSHTLNQQGRSQGILRGGNFSVFYGLRGTPYDIPPEGTILFMEDVNERPHVVERMMYNLKLGGMLEKLSGLIVGRFTEYEEDRSLGKDLYEALADLVKEYNYPVCFHFPVGHVTHNLPLITGAAVELTVEENVTLTFA
ncbi:putative murein peptide carboxypeptidase [termite gut metagenome]|uniref:Putative murein peptide carboxypeptidase n=1 Tax=termite gut metagenome TaxID=433724 RepID=A0A5J4SJ02_9ZZZZ